MIPDAFLVDLDALTQPAPDPEGAQLETEAACNHAPTEPAFAFDEKTNRVAWSYGEQNHCRARIWCQIVDDGGGFLSLEVVEPITTYHGALWWEEQNSGIRDCLGFEWHGHERFLWDNDLSPGQIFCMEGGACYQGYGEDVDYECDFEAVEREEIAPEKAEAAWLEFVLSKDRWHSLQARKEVYVNSEVRRRVEDMCIVTSTNDSFYDDSPRKRYLSLSSPHYRVKVRYTEETREEPANQTPFSFASVNEKGDAYPWAALAKRVETKEPAIAAALCAHLGTPSTEDALQALPRHNQNAIWSNSQIKTVVLPEELVY